MVDRLKPANQINELELRLGRTGGDGLSNLRTDSGSGPQTATEVGFNWFLLHGGRVRRGEWKNPWEASLGLGLTLRFHEGERQETGPLSDAKATALKDENPSFFQTQLDSRGIDSTPGSLTLVPGSANATTPTGRDRAYFLHLTGRVRQNWGQSLFSSSATVAAGVIMVHRPGGSGTGSARFNRDFKRDLCTEGPFRGNANCGAAEGAEGAEEEGERPAPIDLSLPVQSESDRDWGLEANLDVAPVEVRLWALRCSLSFRLLQKSVDIEDDPDWHILNSVMLTASLPLDADMRPARRGRSRTVPQGVNP